MNRMVYTIKAEWREKNLTNRKTQFTRLSKDKMCAAKLAHGLLHLYVVYTAKIFNCRFYLFIHCKVDIYAFGIQIVCIKCTYAFFFLLFDSKKHFFPLQTKNKVCAQISQFGWMGFFFFYYYFVWFIAFWFLVFFLVKKPYIYIYYVPGVLSAVYAYCSRYLFVQREFHVKIMDLNNQFGK